MSEKTVSIDVPAVPKLSKVSDVYFCPKCYHVVGCVLPSGKVSPSERKCKECGQKIKWYDGKD